MFGSGAYAQRFFALYSMDYPVYAVLDNNREKWGQEISGVQICGPQLLQQFDPAEYKVLICVKRHMSIIRQLEEMAEMVRACRYVDEVVEIPLLYGDGFLLLHGNNKFIQDKGIN